MNKKATKIIVSILSVCIIAVFIILFMIQSKTYYNKEDTIGNTAGNLYNGGLFCEQNGQIYFSNPSDDGILYSMDTHCNNVKKISDDKICYINADDHYLYYSRINYAKESGSQSVFLFFNRGIYRIGHDGSNLKQLYSDPSGLLSLYGNKILYQHYNKRTGTTFYEVGIDAKNETKLSEEPLIPASYYDGYLYYSGVTSDHSIHAYNIKTKEDQIVYDGLSYLPIATKDSIYFIDPAQNYSLCKVDYQGGEPVVLLDRFCSSYNLSFDGQTIYYQIDGGDSNRIGKLDLSSMVTETIMDGNFKNINVTSNYVFFQTFDESETYAYTPSTKELMIFKAPVIK